MTQSYAQKEPLSCRECGQPFEATIWYIVDTAADPHLYALVKQNTIHAFPCPHCGHEAILDAPLLLYRSDKDSGSVLVFGHIGFDLEEEHQQHIAPLIDYLRTNLADSWDETWVEQMYYVPGHMLPAYLYMESEL